MDVCVNDQYYQSIALTAFTAIIVLFSLTIQYHFQLVPITSPLQSLSLYPLFCFKNLFGAFSTDEVVVPELLPLVETFNRNLRLMHPSDLVLGAFNMCALLFEEKDRRKAIHIQNKNVKEREERKKSRITMSKKQTWQ